MNKSQHINSISPMLVTRPPEIERIRREARLALPEEFEEFAAPEEFDDLPDDPTDDDLDDEDYTDTNAGFIIKPGETWLQTGADTPQAEMLFGSFWFQDELCILFADTNAGKSILAVQIGNAISRGQAVGPFQMNGPAETVLYFDFELSTTQFRKRYVGDGTGNAGAFNPKFLRAVLNLSSNKARKFNSYGEYITNEIENALISTKAKVLIIDNLTCLRFGTHFASGALNLVQYLQSIKETYQLSILVLAHTPKRNLARPITRNDLLGSKMLINFCDSAFAIGESQLPPPAEGCGPLRYLKQIKQRSTHEEFGAANVCMCSIVKLDGFLQFQFNGTAYEAEHLARQHEQYRKISDTCIAGLHQQGLSVRQVAEKLGIASTTVFRALKRMEK
ncbi:AAA family ATPase [Mucilaginibacter flavidus]|uniref:AAA family ATPase n=1 Tax=Mucilaginibacter flavidus TaxID=2949309 RepID=UPI002092B968|nr:AAA family ATPase [Mucilaginibacter flavidus]MCO5950741.1 AAA family ATPase [Mucilaginibacter flavidus]